MVAEAPAGIGEGPAFTDGIPDLLLDGVDLFGRRQHRVLVRARDVRMSPHTVAFSRPPLSSTTTDPGSTSSM